ncbi:MAG: transglycosylase SLT domain-containing protein [Burkholderiales bacterium]|nr:transglycosylase SLT domain-containing protein [Burkholderiales bacterium]
MGAALAGLWLVPGAAQAGAQQYAPMSAAVRYALSSAVAADRAPPEPRFASMQEKIDWLAAMAERLPRRWKPDYQTRIEFLKTVRFEADRAGLDPQLVLALIDVESYFRRYAVSHAGARGYMQVMPFWADAIGDGDASKLFDMRINLRYGCTILRHYLDTEGGNLFLALGRYNGSRGRPEYPDAVLRAMGRWSFGSASGAPARATASTVGAVPAAPLVPARPQP